jgi:hypothetical protein
MRSIDINNSKAALFCRGSFPRNELGKIMKDIEKNA